MEKFLEHLQEAAKNLRIVEHLAYVTMPVVKDKRLLLKIIVETNNSMRDLISAILQYDYLYKKINLTKDPKVNMETFLKKCAPNYRIDTEELKIILELKTLVENHKKSTMEFVKEDKLVILSENMSQRIVTIELAKQFLQAAKSILEKIREKIKN